MKNLLLIVFLCSCLFCNCASAVVELVSYECVVAVESLRNGAIVIMDFISGKLNVIIEQFHSVSEEVTDIVSSEFALLVDSLLGSLESVMDCMSGKLVVGMEYVQSNFGKGVEFLSSEFDDVMENLSDISEDVNVLMDCIRLLKFVRRLISRNKDKGNSKKRKDSSI